MSKELLMVTKDQLEKLKDKYRLKYFISYRKELFNFFNLLYVKIYFVFLQEKH